MTDKLPSEIFEDAAQELRDHGKCSGEIMSEDGRVCLVGSVGLACGIEITEKTNTDQVIQFLPDDVITGLNAIAEKHIADEVANFDRHYANYPPVMTPAELYRQRAYMATRFNDGSTSPHHPRKPADETEIIDALMEQAKYFRNEGK